MGRIINIFNGGKPSLRALKALETHTLICYQRYSQVFDAPKDPKQISSDWAKITRDLAADLLEINELMFEQLKEEEQAED